MANTLGRCPSEAAGKRVRVRLRNGTLHGAEPASAEAKAGWPADGKGACDWALTGNPFDIIEWELAT